MTSTINTLRKKMASLRHRFGSTFFLSAGNIREQENFANLTIYAKFAKFSCTRIFPVIQYVRRRAIMSFSYEGVIKKKN